MCRGKGKGLVSTKKIPKSSRILSGMPVTTAPMANRTVSGYGHPYASKSIHSTTTIDKPSYPCERDCFLFSQLGLSFHHGWHPHTVPYQAYIRKVRPDPAVLAAFHVYGISTCRLQPSCVVIFQPPLFQQESGLNPTGFIRLYPLRNGRLFISII
jgi:hypothetical protein